MAGGLDEPAGERESFLGGGGGGAAAVSAAAVDPEQETMPHGDSSAGSATNMRARSSRRRWREDGLAEPLEEGSNGARGDRNRSECELCCVGY